MRTMPNRKLITGINKCLQSQADNGEVKEVVQQLDECSAGEKGRQELLELSQVGGRVPHKGLEERCGR